MNLSITEALSNSPQSQADQLKTSTLEFEIHPIDNSILQTYWVHLTAILDQLKMKSNIQIKNRGNLFLLEGQKRNLPIGERVLLELHSLQAKKGIDKEKVHLCYKENYEPSEKSSSSSEEPHT